MPQSDNNSYKEVRQRLLSCVRVSHGISLDHSVFMDELEYILSRVFALFFPDVDVKEHAGVYESLRSEFEVLNGDELKQLIIQERGYFRSIVWPRIEYGLCAPLIFILSSLDIKWIGRLLGLLLFPFIWSFDKWIALCEFIEKLILPSRFWEEKTVTFHFLSWCPISSEETPE